MGFRLANIDDRAALVDGDVIVATISGLGSMTNRCVRVSDDALGPAVASASA